MFPGEVQALALALPVVGSSIVSLTEQGSPAPTEHSGPVRLQGPLTSDVSGTHIPWTCATKQMRRCSYHSFFLTYSLFILFSQTFEPIKSQDLTLPTKIHLVKAMVFPVVMYGCESWTIKKAEHQRIDAFELWCWRRLLRSLGLQEDPTSPF